MLSDQVGARGGPSPVLAARRREEREGRESLARSGLTGPKATGVRGPEQVPPGPHELQGRPGGLTNAPVAFTARPGEAVYSTVAPRTPHQAANADRRSRPRTYFQVVRVPEWTRN
ncbi:MULTISPECIES: hypothetical protein [unclassified Nocardiopsis]|uniref:hypothetical protein n=1 Tax=unclassified Nocardiopsis TaxID=2649073 RepID=UPI0013573E09|nr:MULTISPECIES: hypothetical protein [unclassified Nocardiopsis]